MLLAITQISDYDELLSNDEEDDSETESSRSSCEWETEEEEQLADNDAGVETGTDLANR
jgi:hypothetical protein